MRHASYHLGYAAAIHHLLNNPGDYAGAYKTASDVVNSSKDKDAIEWMSCVEKGELPTVNRNGGWAKIAFCYTMHYLKNNYKYSDALKDILSKGGDTDTNCCIIGAVMGALNGVEGIPSEIISRVLEFDPAKEKGVKRPEFIVPKHVAAKSLEKLIANRPSELKFVGDTSEYPVKK
jgi:ADP-ribosylglycohydrolase